MQYVNNCQLCCHRILSYQGSSLELAALQGENTVFTKGATAEDISHYSKKKTKNKPTNKQKTNIEIERGKNKTK